MNKFYYFILVFIYYQHNKLSYLILIINIYILFYTNSSIISSLSINYFISKYLLTIKSLSIFYLFIFIHSSFLHSLFILILYSIYSFIL